MFSISFAPFFLFICVPFNWIHLYLIWIIFVLVLISVFIHAFEHNKQRLVQLISPTWQGHGQVRMFYYDSFFLLFFYYYFFKFSWSFFFNHFQSTNSKNSFPQINRPCLGHKNEVPSYKIREQIREKRERKIKALKIKKLGFSSSWPEKRRFLV